MKNENEKRKRKEKNEKKKKPKEKKSENIEKILVKMPSCIEEDNLINEGDVAIKHCRIRVLHKTPKEAIF